MTGVDRSDGLPGSSDPGESADRDLQLLAAALRADAADVAGWSRVLTQTLGEVLPAGMVTVERDRSLADRLAGRPGRVVRVTVAGRDRQLQLAEHRERIEARIIREVRGVVIARDTVDLDVWLSALVREIDGAARSSAASRRALAAFLGT